MFNQGLRKRRRGFESARVTGLSALMEAAIPAKTFTACCRIAPWADDGAGPREIIIFRVNADFEAACDESVQSALAEVPDLLVEILVGLRVREVIDFAGLPLPLPLGSERAALGRGRRDIYCGLVEQP